MNKPGTGIYGYILIFTIQIVFLAIFGIFTDYDDGLKPNISTQTMEGFIIPKYARERY